MHIFFLICLFFSFTTEYTISPCNLNEINAVPLDETTLTIQCSSNSIVDIFPLSALGTLQNLNQLYLYFYDNSIEDLSPLSVLETLQNLNQLTLYFSGNSIEDLSPFSVLGTLQNLNQLTLYFQNLHINDYCTLIFLPNYTMGEFKLCLDTSPNSFNSYSNLEQYLISCGCPSAECHYSCENCKVSHSADNCIKCNEGNHRLEFFEENYYGQCICQEGYYDDYENSFCQKCPDFWYNFILMTKLINGMTSFGTKASSAMPGGAAARSSTQLSYNVYLYYTDFDKPQCFSLMQSEEEVTENQFFEWDKVKFIEKEVDKESLK